MMQCNVWRYSVTSVPPFAVRLFSQFCSGWDLDEKFGTVSLVRDARDSYEA